MSDYRDAMKWTRIWTGKETLIIPVRDQDEIAEQIVATMCGHV